MPESNLTSYSKWFTAELRKPAGSSDSLRASGWGLVNIGVTILLTLVLTFVRSAVLLGVAAALCFLAAICCFALSRNPSTPAGHDQRIAPQPLAALGGLNRPGFLGDLDLPQF